LDILLLKRFFLLNIEHGIKIYLFIFC